MINIYQCVVDDIILHNNTLSVPPKNKMPIFSDNLHCNLN